MACGPGFRRVCRKTRFFPISSRRPGKPQQPLALQFHALLHPRTRADPVAPGGHISEAGAVDQRLAPGVDRVEAEIGDGDLAASIGSVCGLFEVPIGLLELDELSRLFD